MIFSGSLSIRGLSGKRDSLYLANLLLVALIIVGLFLPWLWRGYDRYMTLDEATGRIQVRYGRRLLLSPFYVILTEDNEIESITLLYNLESNIVGLITMFSSLFTVIKYYDLRMYGYSLGVSLVSVLLFFLTLGGAGLGLGSVTYLGVGFFVEILCLLFIVIIMFSRMLSS